jgi:hypothetical protein
MQQTFALRLNLSLIKLIPTSTKSYTSRLRTDEKATIKDVEK